MAFSKIAGASSSPDVLTQRGAMTLPNQPTISASALKQEFDAPAKECVAPAVNRLVDELQATTSAASLGASAPAGRTGTTVQGVINSISSDLASLETSAAPAIEDAHTHDNKTVIDKFSESAGGDPLYNGQPIGQTSDYSTLSNKPKINSVELTGNKSLSDLGVPTTLAQLGDDTGHRTVSDTEKSTWNGKSTVSVTQVVSTGTKIATITVDGNNTDLYASGGGGGGGSVNDAYKKVKVGTTEITASGEDTLELVAGSNVTLTPDGTNKKVTISASGGGQSSGDMLASDYDSDYAVKTAGGIKAYVTSQAYSLPTASASTLGGIKVGTNLSIDGSGVLSATDTTYTSKVESQGGTDVSLCTTGEKYTWNHKQDTLTWDTAPTNNSTNPVYSGGVYTALTNKADASTVSGIQALIPSSATTSNKLATASDIPTITDTYSSSSHDGMSGVAVSSAISGKADDSDLDSWTSTSQVTSGSISFTGLSDSASYSLPYFQNTLASITSMVKTGSGSNVTLTFTTNAAAGTVGKLRILKG